MGHWSPGQKGHRGDRGDTEGPEVSDYRSLTLDHLQPAVDRLRSRRRCDRPTASYGISGGVGSRARRQEPGFTPYYFRVQVPLDLPSYPVSPTHTQETLPVFTPRQDPAFPRTQVGHPVLAQGKPSPLESPRIPEQGVRQGGFFGFVFSSHLSLS